MRHSGSKVGAIAMLAISAGVCAVLPPGRTTDALAEKPYHWQLAREAIHKYRGQPDIRRCSIVAPLANSKIPLEFLQAVLVAENAARPPLRQKVEHLIARTHLFWAGNLPNMSLGIAQLRVSTARNLHDGRGTAGHRSDDAALLLTLLEPCSNAVLAYEYLTHLLDSSGHPSLDRKAAFDILRLYNGQSKPSPENQLYLRVVWSAYEQLQDGWMHQPHAARTENQNKSNA